MKKIPLTKLENLIFQLEHHFNNFFNRNNFLIPKNQLSVEKLLSVLDTLVLKNNIYKNFFIDEVSSLENFKKNSLLFLDKEIDLSKINFSEICLITSNIEVYNNYYKKNIFLVNNFDSSFKKIVNFMYVHEDSSDFKDEFSYVKGSYISKYSTIDESSVIFKNCVIGRGVEIGKNCIIKNNCVIKNSIIRDNVIISDNSTVGSTGFGFDLKAPGASNIIPQIGIVYIDSNTYIGSNCTIDRGKIDSTHIGKNCMIDNLVHIAHNVFLGDNACVAAQTGISGSTSIGKNLISGGQSGFAGHIKIGDNVIVAAKSGVTKNIKNNSTVAGFPAIDIKDWKKQIIKQKKNEYK